jgi:hypothetical protein
MLIIGLGSKARHGKDSAGESIVNWVNGQRNAQLKLERVLTYPVAGIFKFATALYKECREQHGMTEKNAPLLQRIGSERRAENPNYWIDKLFESIPANVGLVVITDLRYQNEAQAIKDRNGVTVRVDRVNIDGTPYVAGDRPADHPSEIDLDGYNFDYRIQAKTGEVAWVEQQAITLIEYIRVLK